MIFAGTPALDRAAAPAPSLEVAGELLAIMLAASWSRSYEMNRRIGRSAFLRDQRFDPALRCQAVSWHSGKENDLCSDFFVA